MKSEGSKEENPWEDRIDGGFFSMEVTGQWIGWENLRFFHHGCSHEFEGPFNRPIEPWDLMCYVAMASATHFIIPAKW